MARLLGGPFSRAAGKAAGLVFSSARAGQKKAQTIREHVIPTNPRTNAQVSQRTRFNYASQTARAVGRSIYQFDWNRAVRQLPGFQSLVNLFIMAIDRNGGTMETPRSISLGVRHFPATFEAAIDSGAISVSWSDEAGAVSEPTDQAVILAVSTDPEDDSTERLVLVDTSATRGDEGTIISTGVPTGVAAGDFQIGLYFRNQGENIPSRDRRSSARWVELGGE